MTGNALVTIVSSCKANPVRTAMAGPSFSSTHSAFSKAAVPPKDATQLNQTVLLSRVVEVVTPKDATQQNCFVEMSRVVAVVTPKDATQPNCLVESGLSVWPRSRSDSTSHDQFRPVLQILNIFSFWPVELSRIVSTVTPKDATRSHSIDSRTVVTQFYPVARNFVLSI